MPPDEQASTSMADSLSAAIETVETQAPEPAAPSEAPAAPTEAARAAEPAAEPAAPTGERPRGPDGKFQKRDAATPAPPQSAAAPAAAPAVAAADPAKAPAAPAAPGAPDVAPATWTPAAKEKWANLDPAVKGEISRREREVDVALSKATDVRRFGDSVMQEFAPYAKILSDEGATPQAAIRALLETSYTLRFGSPEHKHALFHSLAQQYGIDLGKQIDPEKARLQWELDSRNVNDARQAAAQQDQLQREVQGELEAFMAAPGHEHYGAVRAVMAGLMQSGVAKDLQDAYDRACWADPQIRAALQLAENTRRAAEQAKNRNALLSVNGAPGAVSTGGGVDPANLRGLLEAQFNGGAGRV